MRDRIDERNQIDAPPSSYQAALFVVFSEMAKSFAISDISILGPESIKYSIILKSVSLRCIGIGNSKTEILLTIAGFMVSFNDCATLSSTDFFNGRSDR